MALNQHNKARTGSPTVQTLQASMGIQGPKGRPGLGTGRQTLAESLSLGQTHKRNAKDITGKGRIRKSMRLG